MPGQRSRRTSTVGNVKIALSERSYYCLALTRLPSKQQVRSLQTRTSLAYRESTCIDLSDVHDGDGNLLNISSRFLLRAIKSEACSMRVVLDAVTAAGSASFHSELLLTVFSYST